AWLALAGVAVVAFLCAQRRLPVLLPLGLVFFPLLPVAAASLVESGVRFAERELALPVAGMALGAAWLAARAPVSRAWLTGTPLGARSPLAARAGATEAALALAERALALAPDDLAGGVVRVRSLVRLGRAGDARAAGDRLVAAHPDAPAAQGALGEARMASGDP